MNDNVKISKDGKKYYSYYKKVNKNDKYKRIYQLRNWGFSPKEIFEQCQRENIKISLKTIYKHLKNNDQ